MWEYTLTNYYVYSLNYLFTYTLNPYAFEEFAFVCLCHTHNTLLPYSRTSRIDSQSELKMSTIITSSWSEIIDLVCICTFMFIPFRDKYFCQIHIHAQSNSYETNAE